MLKLLRHRTSRHGTGWNNFADCTQHLDALLHRKGELPHLNVWQVTLDRHSPLPRVQAPGYTSPCSPRGPLPALQQPSSPAGGVAWREAHLVPEGLLDGLQEGGLGRDALLQALLQAQRQPSSCSAQHMRWKGHRGSTRKRRGTGAQMLRHFERLKPSSP
jgi:hypothetical protein